ncbi:TPA: hypothetical protein DCL30_04290 [Candidatus Peribacteria bacterium]|nr:MAG: hypothetical protein A3J91_01905 [Candidatus Peribacteria bacterium RIFOXYC2_FULL_58_10]OGJ83999.1 MAG: hypothetical protein A2529_04345 [Candidatus Peribacteria bacterium RIFOXYD2_FULL_58_15]HAI98725.1 hypothetical protein [Candidatus Peribacteria bacterium]HAS34437.1 hypothetical protein [Candidatus Peribacteria bacterium]
MSTTPERQSTEYVADIKELREGDVVPLGNRRFQLKQIPAESAPYAKWAFCVGDSPSCTTLHRGGILEVNGYLQEYVTYQMRGHPDSDVKFWIVSEPPGGRSTKSTELTLKLGSVEGAQQQPLPLPLEPIREQVQGTLAGAPAQPEHDPLDISSAAFQRHSFSSSDLEYEVFALPPPPPGTQWMYHIAGLGGTLYTPIEPSRTELLFRKKGQSYSVFLRLRDMNDFQRQSQTPRELTIEALGTPAHETPADAAPSVDPQTLVEEIKTTLVGDSFLVHTPTPPPEHDWLFHRNGHEVSADYPYSLAEGIRTYHFPEGMTDETLSVQLVRTEDLLETPIGKPREFTIPGEFLLTPLEEAKDEPASGEIPDSDFNLSGELPDSVELADSSLDLGDDSSADVLGSDIAWSPVPEDSGIDLGGSDSGIDLGPQEPSPEDSDLNLGADSGLSLSEPELPEPAAPDESSISQEEADALLDQVTTELDGRHFVIHAPAPPAGHHWSIAVLDDPDHRSNVRFVTPSGQQGHPFEYQLITQEEPREVDIGLSTNGVPRFSRLFPMPAAPDAWEKLLLTTIESPPQEPSDTFSPPPDDGTSKEFDNPLLGDASTETPEEQVTHHVNAVCASVEKALAIVNGEDTWTNFDYALKDIPEQLKVFFVPEAAIYDLDLASQQSLRETAASLKRLLGCVWPGETSRTYDTKSAKVSRTMRAIAKSVGYVAFGTKQSPHADVEHPHPMRKSIEAVYDRIAGAITRRKRRAFLAHSARMAGAGIIGTLAAQTGYKLWSGAGQKSSLLEEERKNKSVSISKENPTAEKRAPRASSSTQTTKQDVRTESKKTGSDMAEKEKTPPMTPQQIANACVVSVDRDKVAITLPRGGNQLTFGRDIKVYIGESGQQLEEIETQNGAFTIPSKFAEVRKLRKLRMTVGIQKGEEIIYRAKQWLIR